MTVFLAVWAQHTYAVDTDRNTDRQTDRQTDTGRQLVRCLRTASRGNSANIYPVSKKKQDTLLLYITSPNVDRFSKLHYLVKCKCQETETNVSFNNKF